MIEQHVDQSKLGGRIKVIALVWLAVGGIGSAIMGDAYSTFDAFYRAKSYNMSVFIAGLVGVGLITTVLYALGGIIEGLDTLRLQIDRINTVAQSLNSKAQSAPIKAELTACPLCGRDNVASTAISCPGCGYALLDHFWAAQADEKSEEA